jgi:hypothetical protein
MADRRIHVSLSSWSSRIFLLLAIALSGCATPIGVTRVDMITSYEDINANALFGDELSMDTKIVLRRFNLTEQDQMDPPAFIARLHKQVMSDRRRHGTIPSIGRN